MDILRRRRSASSERSGSNPAFVAVFHLAQQDPTEVDPMGLGIDRFEADFQANKGFAHESLSAFPFHFSIGSYPSRLPMGRILHWSETIAARTASIQRGWRALLQSFVGPFDIVFSEPPVAAPLLRSPGHRGWTKSFLFEHTMKLFVRPILFRMSGVDKLHPYSQAGPPGAQARQPRGPRRAEWHPVVDPDHLWQSPPPEQPSHGHLHRLPSLALEQPDLQAITTVQISHRQWFYPLGVSRSKPTFEVYGPHLIDSLGLRQRRPLYPRAPAATSLTLGQLHTFEVIGYRPFRGQWRPTSSIHSSEPAQYLSPAPRAMSLAQTPDPIHPSPAYSLRRALRTTRTIFESFPSLLKEALLPFVTNRSADSKSTTQFCERPSGLQSQLCKPNSFPNLRGCFP